MSVTQRDCTHLLFRQQCEVHLCRWAWRSWLASWLRDALDGGPASPCRGVTVPSLQCLGDDTSPERLNGLTQRLRVAQHSGQEELTVVAIDVIRE